jgi:hypothetical protein
MATQNITPSLVKRHSRKCGSNALQSEVSRILSSTCSLPRLRKSDGTERKRSRLVASVTSAYFRGVPGKAEGRKTKKINNLIIFLSLASAFRGFQGVGR